MKYNQLTILEEVNVNKRWMFKTQCNCGKIEIKRKDWVLSGRTISCKSCASKRTAVKFPPPINFQGIGGLSKTHYSCIKHGAVRRNIPFEVSLEFLWNLYEKQNRCCALTGVPITLEAKIKDFEASNINDNMSVADKIKTFHDYVINNSVYDKARAKAVENGQDIEGSQSH